ncbi:MAG: hypothetical protein WDO18_00230 [Acidobacteriota bacterium]
MRLFFGMTILAVAAHGQWIGYKVAGVPRTSDGKPNLTAPAPRVNGKPDFTGIWATHPAKYGEAETVIPGIGILAVPGDDPAGMSKYFFSVLADYKPDEIQMTAAALDKQKSMRPPPSACIPPSPPMADALPVGRRVIQTDKLIAILYEGPVPRQIHLDGRPLPEDPQPSYTGYSVGKWDGDVLVVETIGIHDTTPLDAMGHPRSSAHRITERIRRRDYGHMDVEVTIQDPLFYTKPITYRFTETLSPDDDVIEWICENERDAPHMRGPQ